MNFWHKLFHPFCSECASHIHMIPMCQSCEILKQTNHELRDQIRHLTLALIKKNEPEQARVSNEELEPIRPRHIPFSVRREQLENADRVKAQLERDRIAQEKLEAELLKANA